MRQFVGKLAVAASVAVFFIAITPIVYGYYYSPNCSQTPPQDPNERYVMCATQLFTDGLCAIDWWTGRSLEGMDCDYPENCKCHQNVQARECLCGG
jgi:hypothetical protein